MSRSLYQFKEDDALSFARSVGAKPKRSGNELVFDYCPYCKGGLHKDRGSFSINITTGQFQCKRSSCSASGNMITLMKDFSFYPNRDIEVYLNRDKQQNFKRFKSKAKPEPKPFAVEYLGKRGISEDVVNKYGITVRKDDPSVVVFSFFDPEGELRFIKYRFTKPEVIEEKGKERCESNCMPILYGMEMCNLENHTLIFTEGQIDSLSLAEAGIENAVSVPNGKNGFTWIPHCWDWLQNFDEFIFFSDKEGDSLTLIDEMRGRLNGRIKHVRLSDYRDCKDANEILQKYGKQALVDAVANAIPLSNPRIKRLSEIKRKNLSDIERFYTCIESLDRIICGLFMGQLIIVTGKKGGGKSTFTQQLGLRAMTAGFKTMFYSGELQGYQFKSWIERQAAGDRYINPFQSERQFTDYVPDANALMKIDQWTDQMCFIYDNESLMVDDEYEPLLETLENSIKNYGCRVLVVDNLMTAMEDDASEDLYRQQTRFVAHLKKMASVFDVCIILVAHPKKGTGSDSDIISGSANIGNLADIVLLYERADDGLEYDSTVKVIKNRTTGYEDHSGIPLYFQASSKRIVQNPQTFDFKLGWQDDFDPSVIETSNVVLEEVDDEYGEIPF